MIKWGPNINVVDFGDRDIINAGPGQSTIGGGFADTITGGVGNEFVDGSGGKQLITAGDRIMPSGGDSLCTILATQTISGGNTILTFANGTTLTLLGVTGGQQRLFQLGPVIFSL